MRRAKVDANQARIVGALRQAGCRVQHLHTVGTGCPDLLVLHRGLLILVEVKDGDKSPVRQNQIQWHTEWREAPLYILRRVEDIPAMLEQVQKDWQL